MFLHAVCSMEEFMAGHHQTELVDQMTFVLHCWYRPLFADCRYTNRPDLLVRCDNRTCSVFAASVLSIPCSSLVLCRGSARHLLLVLQAWVFLSTFLASRQRTSCSSASAYIPILTLDGCMIPGVKTT